MADEHLPLLLFPTPTTAERNILGRGAGKVHTPTIGRQRERITPQLTVLQRAIDAKRVRLQGAVPLENPELVLVLEIAGTVQNFAKAVSKVPGLDWLFELAEEQIEPDEDFYSESKSHQRKPYSGRLFLLGTNHEALSQILALWDRYQENPAGEFPRGLAPFKHVFTQLRTIRHWNVSDRVNTDMHHYWQDRIDEGHDTIRFEIEAWYFDTPQKNEATRAEIEALIGQLANGRILRRALIPEIAYHGFLVELPTTAIAAILAGTIPTLLASDRIMYFRPKAQSITGSVDESQSEAFAELQGSTDRAPIVALLDGLPLTNHTLLANRLFIDDPDGWEAQYEAKDRVHGTLMASLILHGELDGAPSPLTRQLYVRPIMRPDLSDSYNQRRREHTPDDELLIDLIHRAVKRICEGDTDQAAVAPTVRIINLSIGDEARLFVREISPWARLLDWLAVRYSLLFIVSAGNYLSSLELDTPADTVTAMDADQRAALAFTASVTESIERRLISPAESINALTVGAFHADSSTPPVISNRFDLFPSGSISPVSRIGPGYRRSIKPDILMPGGRLLFSERLTPGTPTSTLNPLISAQPPGQRAAAPPLPGQTLSETMYSRGTSNAAALTSRAATQIYDALELLRNQFEDSPPTDFDAVLIKALLVHGAQWGEWSEKLLAERPDFQEIENANSRRIAEKDFITRWLGYGMADVERAINCTAQRATLLGVAELGSDEAFIFSAPLPPSLAGKKEWRRLTLTLAWMSPLNYGHQGYRRAKLWLTPPQDQLRVKRFNSVHESAAKRGTVQHEILEGEDAVAFVDGDRFLCKVNCAADAGELSGKIKFALCVSLEVGIGSNIAVYQEIRDRIKPTIQIQPMTE